MIMEGCQSKSKELSLEEKICPNCGNTVEIFSVDTEAVCDRCGFVIYNDMAGHKGKIRNRGGKSETSGFRT